MRAFLVLLLTALVAVAAGIAGFQAGVASSLAAGTGGVPAIVYLGGGFHFGGLLFLLLLVGLILFAFGGRRRRWGGHEGRFGPMGGHGPMSDGDPRRQWVAEAHRRLHEDEAARAAAAPTTGSATPTGAAGGPPPAA